jgi:hypothetical protein
MEGDWGSEKGIANILTNMDTMYVYLHTFVFISLKGIPRIHNHVVMWGYPKR